MKEIKKGQVPDVSSMYKASTKVVDAIDTWKAIGTGGWFTRKGGYGYDFKDVVCVKINDNEYMEYLWVGSTYLPIGNQWWTTLIKT